MSNRYARQLMLPEIGESGQVRLAGAAVAVVGAGGLGCPVLASLAGAGIGRITVVDHDIVEVTNLHRQPLYDMAAIGRPKVEVAREKLAALNPDVMVAIRVERLTPDNAPALVANHDLVVDAADSFAVTYTLSDACRAAGKPLVSAAVTGLAGYAGAFCGSGPSYRAVFPQPGDAGTCAENGVLGTTVAVLGALQAQMALLILLGGEPTPLGRVLTFDGKRLNFGGFCFADADEPPMPIPFVGVSGLTADDLVVDLRSRAEAPASPVADALRLGMDQIDTLSSQIPQGRIVLCCRTGLRASRAARTLAESGISRLALMAAGD